MGCALLRQILLASPALRRLRAAGCSRLVVSLPRCLIGTALEPHAIEHEPFRCLPRLAHSSSWCAPTSRPLFDRLQELRLGTAAVQELDLENCDHLREVQLSEASGSLRSSLDGAAGRQEAGGKKSKVGACCCC